MTARAYVQIEAQAGQVPEAIAALREIRGNRVPDSDQHGIGQLMMDALPAIPAIKRTGTGVALE
jgi:hypothetical protein